MNSLTQIPHQIATLCLLACLSWACLAVGEPTATDTKPATADGNQDALSTLPPEALIAELRKKLAWANDALAQADARAEAASSTDAATPAEIAEFKLTLQPMAQVYRREIDSVARWQNLRQERARLEREMADWAGLGPPPHSFLLVDELREAVRFQTARLQALLAMDAALEQEAERRKDVLADANGKLRQANERLEGNANSPRWVWLRDMEAARGRLAEARVEGMQIEQRVNQEELAITRQRLAFSGRKLEAAKNQVAFSAADKQQVRERLAAERQRLQAELDALAPAVEASRKALDSANDRLEQGKLAGDAARLADLQDQAELQNEQTENAKIKAQALGRLLDFIKVRENLWALRWSSAENPDPQALPSMYDKLVKLQTELAPIREYLRQQNVLVSGQIFDSERQLQAPASAREAAQVQKLHDLYVERDAVYRRIGRDLDATVQLLDLWKQDLDERHQAEPLPARLKERLAQLREWAAAAWEFEVFAVQDSIEVEGQTITGKRSVTLGKLVTALLILVVGLWLASKLSRAWERLTVRRAWMDESAARIARRWLLCLAGVVLVMSSLVMVKIPLTVFAFTGGALAIGAGFGMQNLLKNLISGLMLLLERPFRPGDLVEVSGIRGRVMDIGMRSSHIRDGNGIETLIPNSTFIEENVTNWTLSNQLVRISVKLGVAYGSPVQELTELLLETADRHGLVQDKPPPQVLFEDFGSDALLFGLYVWVEIKPEVDWRIVASDLRYMINKTLAAHGIVMAFPQRDIHIDTAQPLQVRVLREPPAGK